MKLSQLKHIIAEQVRQLQNQKQSLNEDADCAPSVTIQCPMPPGGVCVAPLMNWSSEHGCVYDASYCCGGSGMPTKGMGGTRADQGPTMG